MVEPNLDTRIYMRTILYKRIKTMWEWLQDVQGWVLSTWENLFIAKRSKNPVGTVFYPFEQWIAHWNSNLPVGTVPLQCPATVPCYNAH